MTLNLFRSTGLTSLPERLGDCTALTTLDLSNGRRQGRRAAQATRRLRGADDAEPDELQLPRHATRADRRLRCAGEDGHEVLSLSHSAARVVGRLRGAWLR